MIQQAENKSRDWMRRAGRALQYLEEAQRGAAQLPSIEINGTTEQGEPIVFTLNPERTAEGGLRLYAGTCGLLAQILDQELCGYLEREECEGHDVFVEPV